MLTTHNERKEACSLYNLLNRVNFLIVVVCSAILSFVASQIPAQGLLITASQNISVEEVKPGHVGLFQ